ncbi:MFS transporter [Propioniferax innocua]|uniref:MFS transporter n=2 Tax=Propioniferax innocua TaxID=1753 RepID=A0A542ZTA6_9ACTN|nr:MFS transporter [Propioniferax innocua]
MTAAIAASMVYSLAMPVLPLFPDEFGISAGSATWIVFVNSLAGAVLTPVIGRLGDVFGPKRTLLGAMASLTVGSLICAVAPNLGVMLVGRVLQGAANSSVPLSIGIARRVLPNHRVPGATSLLSATLGIGSGLGVTLAGVLLMVWEWRSVFAFTAGLGLLAFVLVWVKIPADSGGRDGRIHVGGAIGFALALGLLMVPISEAPRIGVGHPMVWGLLLGCVGVAVPWAISQWRAKDPLINLRTARVPWVAFGYLLNFITGLGIFLSLLTSVLQVQAPRDLPYGLDHNTLVAGLSLLGGNAAMLLAPRPTTWASRRFGTEKVLGTGLLIVALGYTYRIVFRGQLIEIILGYAFVQFGLAILMSGLALLLVTHAPRRETSTVQGVGTTSRMVGMGAAGSLYAGLMVQGSVLIDGRSFPTDQTLIIAFAGVAVVMAVAGVVMFIAGRRRCGA